MFLLVLVQLTMFVRAMFVGLLGTKIFMGAILLGTFIILIIYKRKKTISIRYFHDEGEPQSYEATLNWWNFYKHPLTVSSESRSLINLVSRL